MPALSACRPHLLSRRVSRRPAFTTSLVAAACLCLPVARAAVDFTREVQPILAEHCFHCHGFDEKDRQGGLRLDVRDAALKGGKSEIRAVVPGDPEASELIQRILSPHADEVMPPPDENKPLTAAQKETLRRWIAEGADLRPALGVQLRQCKENAAVPATPLPIRSMRFVSKRQAPHRRPQAPSAPADAATLCRRLHLDLIGPSALAGRRGGLCHPRRRPGHCPPPSTPLPAG
jgi:hypothetical protein